MRLLWRRRKLPATLYRTYYHRGNWFIQTGTFWDAEGERLTIKFVRYDQYQAERRIR